MQAMKRFLTKERLGQFTADRNDPNKPGALSGLSPYLHYGQLSAQRMGLEASKLRSKLKVSWSHQALGGSFITSGAYTVYCPHCHCPSLNVSASSMQPYRVIDIGIDILYSCLARISQRLSCLGQQNGFAGLIGVMPFKVIQQDQSGFSIWYVVSADISRAV